MNETRTLSMRDRLVAALLDKDDELLDREPIDCFDIDWADDVAHGLIGLARTNIDAIKFIFDVVDGPQGKVLASAEPLRAQYFGPLKPSGNPFVSSLPNGSPFDSKHYRSPTPGCSP